MARERSIRAAVADLAGQTAADRAAILDLLDEADRRHIEALLVSYAGRGTIALLDDRGADYSNLPGLSPWLRERIETGSGLTPAALGLLRSCAAEITPYAGGEVPAAAPSLLQQLWSGLRIMARAR